MPVNPHLYMTCSKYEVHLFFEMHLHYTHVCQVKICPIKGARTTRAIKEPTILSESKGI